MEKHAIKSLTGKSRHATRVRTGCKTCRIRKVKCDERRPSCGRCMDTGRECDGYENRSTTAPSRDAVKVPMLRDTYSIPFSIPGSQRERQLLHFYCIHSAPDIGGSLRRDLWYNLVLQFAQERAVVRQSVIALGSMHWHMLSMPQNDEFEHIKQYNRAIRSLRKYITAELCPDPHVVLLCSALFFNCETSQADSPKALEHLNNGLEFLAGILQRQSKARSFCNASPDYILPEAVDPMIVQLFVRLDLQASIYDDTRIPILSRVHHMDIAQQESFSTIQEAQDSLQMLLSRTLGFLVGANENKYTPRNELPEQVRDEKSILLAQLKSWEEKSLTLADSLNADSQSTTDSVIWIQLSKVLQQLCRMFLDFSFPHNSDIFTKSPNPEAEELLMECEQIVRSMHLITEGSSKNGKIMKMTSEIGVLPPLFLLAVKCLDDSICRRAFDLIGMLGGYSEGLFDARLMYRLLSELHSRVEVIQKPHSQWSLEDTALAIAGSESGLDQWVKSLGIT